MKEEADRESCSDSGSDSFNGELLPDDREEVEGYKESRLHSLWRYTAAERKAMEEEGKLITSRLNPGGWYHLIQLSTSFINVYDPIYFRYQLPQ